MADTPGPRQRGAEFVRAASGAVLRPGEQGPEWRTGTVVGLGEAAIARSSGISSQVPERGFAGAPKFWRVTNRAQRGNVQVWMGAFNGEVYPEGATEDRRTWLGPGETMLLPTEAGVHLFGNLFDPRLPDAAAVIERMGGLELETEPLSPGRAAPVRAVGGPIGLPDFLIVPIDGRMRPVGEPMPLYDLYWAKLQRSGVLHRRSTKDPDQRAIEADLLQQRIAEYRLGDEPVDEDGDDLEGVVLGPRGEELSTPQSRAEAGEADLPDMAAAPLEAPGPKR